MLPVRLTDLLCRIVVATSAVVARRFFFCSMS
jgi:hypothetical protein